MSETETFGKSYFEGKSSNYGDYNKVDSDRFWDPVIRTIRKYLKLNEDSVRVLDIGCAYGHLLKRLGEIFPDKKTDVKVFGADISEYALGQVKDREIEAALTRLDLNDTQKDTSDTGTTTRGGIPYKNESFDLVTALDVLEHTQDPQWNFEELHRILKDSGILVAQVPVKDTWAGKIFRKLDKDATHINVPSRKDFLQGLEENGFEVLEKTMFLPLLNDRKIPAVPVVMQVVAKRV